MLARPIKIETYGMEKILQNIQVNKASIPDNIPNQLLEETASQIATAVMAIFQKSLDNGIDMRQSTAGPCLYPAFVVNYVSTYCVNISSANLKNTIFYPTFSMASEKGSPVLLNCRLPCMM